MRLSLGNAWDETKAVIRRDGGALFTIALALLLLPGSIADLASPNVPPGEPVPPGWWSILSFAALLLSLAGQIAITRIALGRKGTVGEAISHGFRRLPVLFAALLLWALPFALLIIGLAASAGVTTPEELRQRPELGLPISLLLLFFLYFLVRFLLLTPVVTAEPIGSLAALKRSLALSKGRWWKLFLTILVIALVAIITLGALQFGVGSVIILLFGPPEQWSLSDLLQVLLSQLLGAVFSIVFATLIASYYRQLTADQASVPHAGVD